MQGCVLPCRKKIEVLLQVSRRSDMRVGGRSRCGTGLPVGGRLGRLVPLLCDRRAVSLVTQPSDVDGTDRPGLYVRLPQYPASGVPYVASLPFPWLRSKFQVFLVLSF